MVTACSGSFMDFQVNGDEERATTPTEASELFFVGIITSYLVNSYNLGELQLI